MPEIDINKKRGNPNARVELVEYWKKVGDLKAPNNLVTPLDWSQAIDTSSYTKYPTEDDFFIPIGKAEDGYVAYDLSVGANLLAAGGMFSGVGMFRRVTLLHLMKTYTPEKLRILLIDPIDALADFDGAPHLLRPRAKTIEGGLKELDWFGRQYKKRLEKITGKGSGSIWNYEKKRGGADPEIPHVLMFCSETGELLRADKNNSLKAIFRSVCAPRGLGLYTVHTTQQPNKEDFEAFRDFPAVVSFQMPYAEESEFFSGSGGAEELLGQGDMFFSFVGGEKFRFLNMAKSLAPFEDERKSSFIRVRAQGFHVALEKTRPMVEEICKKIMSVEEGD